MPSGQLDKAHQATALPFLLAALCSSSSPRSVRLLPSRPLGLGAAAASSTAVPSRRCRLPMATTASSSSQQGRTLPLVDCPQCLVPVVKCKSKNDNFYYRCSNRCGKWWFEDAYELYLRNNPANLLESSFVSGHNPAGAVQVVQQPAATTVGGFEMVALDLKLLLSDIKLEIGSLKTEVKELKDEVKKEKSPIVLDNAAVVFLAIFVTVLVAIVWMK